MKNLFTFLILAAVIVAIVVVSKKSPKEELVPAPERVSQVVVTDEVLPYANLSGQYSLDIEQSKAYWEGSKKLVPYSDIGEVSFKEGMVTFESGTITEGSLVVDLKTIAAIKTGAGGGEEKLSGHLQSEDFFNVEKFPEATFMITEVSPLSDTILDITGDITIKGITKSVTVPMQVYGSSEQVILVGTLNINRADFDVKYGSETFFDNLGDKVITDEFILDLKLTFTQ